MRMTRLSQARDLSRRRNNTPFLADSNLCNLRGLEGSSIGVRTAIVSLAIRFVKAPMVHAGGDVRLYKLR